MGEHVCRLADGRPRRFLPEYGIPHPSLSHTHTHTQKRGERVCVREREGAREGKREIEAECERERDRGMWENTCADWLMAAHGAFSQSIVPPTPCRALSSWLETLIQPCAAAGRKNGENSRIDGVGSKLRILRNFDISAAMFDMGEHVCRLADGRPRRLLPEHSTAPTPRVLSLSLSPSLSHTRTHTHKKNLAPSRSLSLSLFDTSVAT